MVKRTTAFKSLQGNSDPLNVRYKFYVEVNALIDDVKSGRETKDENLMTIRERIAGMALVGRMISLLDLGSSNDHVAGSAVRKYTAAFTTNGSGRGKKNTRIEPDPDDDDNIISIIDDRS